MSVFDEIAAAADVVDFAIFGDAATYRPKAGASVAVTVIRDIRTEVSLGEIGAFSEKERVEIRASDVAAPVEGDVLEVTDAASGEVERWKITPAGLDQQRLVHTLILTERQ